MTTVSGHDADTVKEAVTELTLWLAGRTAKDRLSRHLNIVLDEIYRLKPFEERCRTLTVECDQARTETIAAQNELAAQLAAQAAGPFADNTMVTVQELADTARVSKMTIYRLIHRGALKAVRVGRCFRVNKAEALALLAEGMQTAQDGAASDPATTN